MDSRVNPESINKFRRSLASLSESTVGRLSQYYGSGPGLVTVTNAHESRRLDSVRNSLNKSPCSNSAAERRNRTHLIQAVAQSESGIYAMIYYVTVV